MKLIIVVATIIFFSLTAGAQPVINAGGVTNIASVAPGGLPNSGIAQGSIFVVNGTGLGADNPNPMNLFQNTTYPLPTSQGLNGTTVLFTFAPGQGPQSPVYGIMLYESATMLAAILPSKAQTGNYSVTVTYSGQTSAAVPVRVVARAFGMFTYGQRDGTPGIGFGPGLIEQLNASGNFVLNTFDTPAVPGQTLLLLGTGLGAVNGDESQGPATSNVIGLSALSFQVYIGNQLATFNPSADYIGRFISGSTSWAGVDIIEVQILKGVQGCYVPVTVVVNGTAQGISSNVTTMAIDPGGAGCSDSAIGYSQADFQQIIGDQAARIGTISVGTLNLTGTAQDGSTVTTRSDNASASFVNMTAQQFHSAPGGSASPGGCIVVPFSGNTAPPLAAVLGTPIDAGPMLNVNGPDGLQQIAQTAGQLTYAGLSGNSPMFDPGGYSLDNGGGGADVGPFQGSFNVPGAPQWTNSASIKSVPTDNNLLVTWNGADPGSVVSILGLSVDLNAGLGAAFNCSAAPSAQQFTIPGYVLSWLPTTATSIGLLAVTSLGQSRFQAPGLEVGYFSWQVGTGIVVPYVPRPNNVKAVRVE